MKEYIKKLHDDRTFKGRLVEVVNREFELKKNDKIENFNIEVARRPPGVRIIIDDGDSILLTKEFRSELEDWDYRIPGGKIYNNLSDYLENVDYPDKILKHSIDAVIEEGKEEAGIIVKNQQLIKVAKSGATMEWDLYYYVVKDFEVNPEGNQTEFAEIIYPDWYSYEKVYNMCLDNTIKEDRTIGILLKYIINNKKK